AQFDNVFRFGTQMVLRQESTQNHPKYHTAHHAAEHDSANRQRTHEFSSPQHSCLSGRPSSPTAKVQATSLRTFLLVRCHRFGGSLHRSKMRALYSIGHPLFLVSAGQRRRAAGRSTNRVQSCCSSEDENIKGASLSRSKEEGKHPSPSFLVLERQRQFL